MKLRHLIEAAQALGPDYLDSEVGVEVNGYFSTLTIPFTEALTKDGSVLTLGISEEAEELD